jgi:hypothetical protein
MVPEQGRKLRTSDILRADEDEPSDAKAISYSEFGQGRRHKLHVSSAAITARDDSCYEVQALQDAEMVSDQV